MKSKYAGMLLGTLVAILVAQVVVFTPQDVNEARPIEVGPGPSGENVEQAMKGVHLVETGQGTREWELWADEALAFKGKNFWRLQRVRATLFSENGVEFKVTGEEGEIETISKNLKISGNVVTRSSNGYVFKTETVSYESKDRKLQSPGAVEMTGPRDEDGSRLVLKGLDLTADLRSSVMRISRQVTAEKRFTGNRHMVLRSEGAEFSGKERSARFVGNVVMDMDEMRITGPEAEFEYDAKKELVKSIDVKGGVKASDTEKWATAQNLKVHFDEDKYVFRGNPLVVQDSDELRGDEIVFMDGGRKVLVQRARAKVDDRTLEKAH
jgi:LPS export ABC transporter protein LptC